MIERREGPGRDSVAGRGVGIQEPVLLTWSPGLISDLTHVQESKRAGPAPQLGQATHENQAHRRANAPAPLQDSPPRIPCLRRAVPAELPAEAPKSAASLERKTNLSNEALRPYQRTGLSLKLRPCVYFPRLHRPALSQWLSAHTPKRLQFPRPASTYIYTSAGSYK